MSTIEVGCENAGTGWQCRVTVTDDRGSSAYEVGVPPTGPWKASIGSGPGPADIERLVRETVGFLLEREPRTSILARFDLPVVERYFPEFPAEIRRRLSG